MEWYYLRSSCHSVSNKAAGWSRVAALAATVAMFSATATMAQDGPRIIMGTPESGPQQATRSDIRALAAEQGSVRVIVGFDMNFMPEGDLSVAASAQQRATIASRQDGVLSALAAPGSVTRFETVPFVAMSVNANDIDRLLSLPGITSIEQDIPVPPAMSDSAPLVDAPRLWRQDAAGAGTSIAILDTGVRPNHAATAGKIVGSACYSLNSGSSISLCPNGQNEQVTRDRARAGTDCDTSIAGCGHGTHVATIAAGQMGGNHGMAREAGIVAIQVFSRFDGSGNCSPSPAPCVLSWTSDSVKGLERAFQWRNRYNIAAVNMSLGGGRYYEACDGALPTVAAVILNLRSVGVATVISSGNNFYRDSVGAPSCISSAITAGSTTKDDIISPFSNHATMVNLLAPGSSIVAADADGGRRALTTKSGTSMAAPHIAGAFAMLRSHKPDASVDEIESALVCGGVPITVNAMPKPRISMVAARAYLDNPDTEKTWTFRNDRQLREWTPIRGNWVRNENTMQTTANFGFDWYLIQSPFCADNIQVDARIQRTIDEVTGQGAGVLISSEMDANANFSGLMFQFRKYRDEIDVSILEVRNYNGVISIGNTALLCQNINVLPGTDPEEMLNLRIIKRGNDLRFLMNGTQVCRGRTSASFANGKVGIFMNATRFSNDTLTVGRVDLRALGGDKGYLSTLPSALATQGLAELSVMQRGDHVHGSIDTVSSR